MMSNESYLQEIAQIRQQRAQQDAQQRIEQVAEEWRQARAQRDDALEQEDPDTWDYADRECERLQKEYQQLVPKPPPQISEPTKAYLNQREAFNRRYGAAAVQAYTAGHQLALKAGLKPDTPDYFKFVDDALEMYGKSYNGVRFDPSEKSLHANEVCQMLGLTADQYNAQWRKMHAEGRDSGSQQRQQWGKKVG